jgi:alpha-glucosidase
MNLGVSGVPIVGSDVGGFSGNPSPELYARWLQAAALSPFLRSHSEQVSKPHEPYSFGDEYTAINRGTIELRYRLLPYLYSVFQEHTRDGSPVMRPLWFEYPSDDRTYMTDDQYLVGRDLLVAPVVVEGTTKRRVYFPRGDAWVDWWTGRRHEGGTEAEVEAPLDRLPLFARAGSAIPTQAPVQHTGEMSKAPLTLVVVRGAAGTSSFYEDAGEGYEYTRGASRTTTAALEGDRLRLSRAGSYAAQRALASVEFLGIEAAPREVRAGGRALPNPSFDAASRRLVVQLPAAAVEEVTLVP